MDTTSATPEVTSRTCVVMLYVIYMGRLSFIVQDSVNRVTGKGSPRTKFPSVKQEPQETIEETLQRGMEEDILEVPADLFPFIEYTYSTYMEGNISGNVSEKRFYLLDATKCPGLMRAAEQKKDDGTELGIPYFFPVEDLAGKDGDLYWRQRPGIAAAMVHLNHTGRISTLPPKLLKWAIDEIQKHPNSSQS